MKEWNVRDQLLYFFSQKDNNCLGEGLKQAFESFTINNHGIFSLCLKSLQTYKLISVKGNLPLHPNFKDHYDFSSFENIKITVLPKGIGYIKSRCDRLIESSQLEPFSINFPKCNVNVLEFENSKYSNTLKKLRLFSKHIPLHYLHYILTGEYKISNPIIFISYAWGKEGDSIDEFINLLVREFGRTFKNIVYDKKIMDDHGKRLTKFMDEEIPNSDKVIIVGSPTYLEKSQKKDSGVFKECELIKKDLDVNPNTSKYVPIYINGIRRNSLPNFLNDIPSVDFNNVNEHLKLIANLRDKILDN